jgi:hypothetical protein
MATKRTIQEASGAGRPKRPTKKQRRLDAYHSDSDDEPAQGQGQDFSAVNLEDSDGDDLDAIAVDAEGGSEESASTESNEDAGGPRHAQVKSAPTRRGAGSGAEQALDSESEADSTSDEDASSDKASVDELGGAARAKSKSKRNDPAAFATSLSKILNTKLSTSRRKDPVLAGSAAAHAASRAITDSALEVKARKQLRENKRLAKEKGRVRDVLAPIPAASAVTTTEELDEAPVARRNGVSEGVTTAQILETEKRLRKVAQRGVIKLFNAVRVAQVKAAEAERTARSEGVVGQGAREERVTEMTRKGFLDLIAQGGGKMKKGGLQEA